MFKEVADIKTADMLNLPVPNAHYHNIAVKPSNIQKKMVESLSERAQLIRDSQVGPTTDNMLKITNDGRKLALDQRLSIPFFLIMNQAKSMHVLKMYLRFMKRIKRKKQHSLSFVICQLLLNLLNTSKMI